MNIKEMHYDFKQKLNVIDSHKYVDLQIPEIDWKLNEAQELFVKIVAEPRLQTQLGFEVNQRTIDDIRTVVINQTPTTGIIPSVFSADLSSYLVALPTDYSFYIGGKCLATKGVCIGIQLNVREIQHDDEGEVSPFDKSSFLWRTTNIRFIKEGIRLFTDKTFTPTKFVMDYIKKLTVIHNAEDFNSTSDTAHDGGYNTLYGVALTGHVDCELPYQVHREVVDLAVFITAGDLNLSSYGIKQNKLRLNSGQ